MKVNEDGFLWLEEVKVVHEMVREFKHVFTWDESEKGVFSDEYFEPVQMPVVDHEPSNAAYWSAWFWVMKKDGKIFGQ